MGVPSTKLLKVLTFSGDDRKGNGGGVGVISSKVGSKHLGAGLHIAQSPLPYSAC